MEKQQDIPARIWGRAFARSFFLQSVWNGERMQNIGFVYSIAPFLENGEEQDVRKKLSSHLEFFNTNPYFGAAIIGAVGRLEADKRKPEEIRSFKRSLMGPFGALGDSIFWGALKPAATLAGVSLAMQGHAIWAVVATLLIYNSVAIFARAWGYFSGVYYGRWMVYRFTRIRFTLIRALIGLLAVLLLASISVWGGTHHEFFTRLFAGHLMIATTFGCAIVLIGSEIIERGIKADRFFLLFGVVAIIIGLAVNI